MLGTALQDFPGLSRKEPNPNPNANPGSLTALVPGHWFCPAGGVGQSGDIGGWQDSGRGRRMLLASDG